MPTIASRRSRSIGDVRIPRQMRRAIPPQVKQSFARRTRKILKTLYWSGESEESTIGLVFRDAPIIASAVRWRFKNYLIPRYCQMLFSFFVNLGD